MKGLYMVFLLALSVTFLIYLSTNYSYIYAQTQRYSFISKWGSKGTDDGQFNGPRGIAVDTYGKVYIVDSQNYRIQEFGDERSGHAFITKWGSKGTTEGQFVRPFDIAIDSSGIAYVSDNGNYNVQGFYNGIVVIAWGSYGSGNSQFKGATGLAVNSSGYVYVADYSTTHRIQKFTYDGKFIGWIGKCTAGPNCDVAYQRAQDFGCNSNTCTAGGIGSGDGQFWIPTNIAVDYKTGYIYVADTYNHRIQKFTYDGKFIGWIGKCTAGPNCDVAYQRAQDFGCNSNTCTGTGNGTLGGQFQYPIGMAVDSSGNVYVADSGNSRIQKFFSDGSIATVWGSYCDMISGTGCIDPDGTSGPLSSGDGQFSAIGDIAVDSINNVYVSDYGNNRVEVFAQK